jgi:serine/threonine protein kinase
MMDENYNCKIIDFGDARKVSEESVESKQSKQSGFVDHQPQGRKDTFVGTINYQSPEVITGEDQSFAIDTWALGNILFKMLVGTVPFKGTNPNSVHRDIQ